MKLPGLAWLELSVGERAGQTVYRQRALFHWRVRRGPARQQPEGKNRPRRAR